MTKIRIEMTEDVARQLFKECRVSVPEQTLYALYLGLEEALAGKLEGRFTDYTGDLTIKFERIEE